MEYGNYFLDWLCLVDFVVVAIDLIGIILGNVSKSASTLVKIFRMLRLLRLLRLIRATKMAIELRRRAATVQKVLTSKPPKTTRYRLSKSNAAHMQCKLVQLKMLRQFMALHT